MKNFIQNIHFYFVFVLLAGCSGSQNSTQVESGAAESTALNESAPSEQIEVGNAGIVNDVKNETPTSTLMKGSVASPSKKALVVNSPSFNTGGYGEPVFSLTGSPTPPEPGIAVMDDQFQPIRHNPDARTDFSFAGTAPLGGQIPDKTYTISNTSDAPFIINEVSNKNYNSNNPMQIIKNGSLTSLPATIGAGDSVTFTLRTATTVNNMYTGQIEIVSNNQNGETEAFVHSASIKSYSISYPNITLIYGGYPGIQYQMKSSTNAVGPYVNGPILTADANGNIPWTEAMLPQNYHQFISIGARRTMFNVAAAVGAPTASSCSSDSSIDTYDCAGQANGQICGLNGSGKVLVCITEQCRLMGDANLDEEVNLHDLNMIGYAVDNSRPEVSFTCDGAIADFQTTIKSFSDIAFAASAWEGELTPAADYNTRVRTLCKRIGQVKVFNGQSGGPVNWDANGNFLSFKQPETLCIDNLGVYDSETGVRTGNNSGFLNGKYAKTSVTSINNPGAGFPVIDRLSSVTNASNNALVNPKVGAVNNDFRVNFNGVADNAVGSVSTRKAVIWSTEAQLYYDINQFRNTLFTDSFIDELGLPYEISQNLKTRQFRPDLTMTNQTLLKSPALTAYEDLFPTGLQLFPEGNNMTTSLRTRGPYSNFASLPSMSFAYDSGVTVGDYAGLMQFWVLGNNTGFPTDAFYGEGPDWPTKILSPANNALSNWAAFRYTGDSEVYKYTQYAHRIWGARPCGGNTKACNKGMNLNNVMMFDEANISKDGIFPFSAPSGFNQYDGPLTSDLASMFISAVFYDLAFEAGLGLHKTDLLAWKTISMINANPINFTMRNYGDAMLSAAQALWGNTYYYDVKDVLTSRGVPTEGVTDFRANLPAAIGSGALETVSASNFGSSHPDSQPSIGFYGNHSLFQNGYTHAAGGAYVAYQFYKHSKYGPCDKLVLTNGTFTTNANAPFNWSYNNDGTFYTELTNRQLGNLIVLAPNVPGKKSIRWLRSRQRCANEATGFYAEDVRPLGFRVIKATKNGFSFTVLKLDPTQYQLNILDPSEASLGTSIFNWTITDAHYGTRSDSGSSIVINVVPDKPITIHVERTRNSVVDSIEVRDRTNDLDRQSGNAFVLNLTGIIP